MGKKRNGPQRQPHVRVRGLLAPEQRQVVVDELRKVMADHSYKPVLPEQVELLWLVIPTAAQKREKVRDWKSKIGEPNETALVDGQKLTVRDNLGLPLDPEEWTDPDCMVCGGRTMVPVLRPMTVEAVKLLLEGNKDTVEAHPEAAGSIFCRHGVSLDVDCGRCGNERAAEGLAFRTLRCCECAVRLYVAARAAARDAGLVPVITSWNILDATTRAASEAEQQAKVMKEMGASVIKCLHDISIHETCLRCRRIGKAQKLDDALLGGLG